MRARHSRPLQRRDQAGFALVNQSAPAWLAEPEWSRKRPHGTSTSWAPECEDGRGGPGRCSCVPSFTTGFGVLCSPRARIPGLNSWIQLVETFSKSGRIIVPAGRAQTETKPWSPSDACSCISSSALVRALHALIALVPGDTTRTPAFSITIEPAAPAALPLALCLPVLPGAGKVIALACTTEVTGASFLLLY